MSTDLKITAARLHRVRMPLVHAFRTSSHRKTFLDHILVELEDASGAVGWGEIASPSDPYFAPETVETCWQIAGHYLLPAVLGQQWQHPEQVSRLWAKVRGNQFAKAGVDVAAWVLWSAVRGVPLAQALGGTRTEVVAGVSLGIEPTIDGLLAEVERQVAAGYPRVKLKIAPGWDVEPVRAVRAAYPELDLHVDANGIYSGDDLDYLRALDDFGLTMIEQPFAPRNLLDHARLQRQVATPICLDESIETLDDLETALSVGALKVLNIKVSRMGGLTAPAPRTIGRSMPGSRSGAAACTSSASAGAPTSPSPASPDSPSHRTCPPRRSTTPGTSSNPASSPSRASYRCPRQLAWGIRSTPT